MDFYDAIKKRHSIRKYKPDVVSDEISCAGCGASGAVR